MQLLGIGSLQTLLLQLFVILLAARLMGWLFRRLNQPQVVGEMTAGILLGPSLLGWLAPEWFATLFPPESLRHLHTLSQVGLLLFMFMVGLDLDLRKLRDYRRVAWVTSHASIVIPFALGLLLATHLYSRLSDSSVPFLHFALFMGTAMSITAFPVLARILTEYNLQHTHLGVVAIVCAAVDDVTAWLILAWVVFLVNRSADALPLWLALFGVVLYIICMWIVVRPALARLAQRFEAKKEGTRNCLSLVLLLLIISACLTEWLGIHALFGAFLAGVIMPKDKGLFHAVEVRLEGAIVLLLPLFFTFTGLRTSIGILEGPMMWLECALVIAVAVAGKFGGASIAAYLAGMPWREAVALGVLMNTRGLVELVILNIGLDIGVIPPNLFTMMVLMALLTTAMTLPLLRLIYFSKAQI
jgi:Kef-type K+ transport system membrane component KefB